MLVEEQKYTTSPYLRQTKQIFDFEQVFDRDSDPKFRSNTKIIIQTKISTQFFWHQVGRAKEQNHCRLFKYLKNDNYIKTANIFFKLITLTKSW